MSGRKKRILLLLIATGLACAFGIIVWFDWQREPAYRGKSLSEWIDAAAYQDVAWWPGKKATDAAFQAMGTNALPFLLQHLAHVGDQRSAFKEKVASFLFRHDYKKLARSYHDPYGQERWFAALDALRALRPQAKEVVPVLVAIYRKDRAQQTTVLNALGWLGARDAIPFLLAEAANTNAHVRQGVFNALEAIHQDPESSIPALIEGLKDSDLEVRCSAVGALQKFGADARNSVPALTRFVQEEENALKQSPNSAIHLRAKEAAENALAAIMGKQTVLESPVSPVNPVTSLAVSLAYKHVALVRMLAEANLAAEKLHLRTRLPMEEDSIRKIYVAPPRLMRFLGSLDTDRYSFGFSEAGRLRFITRLRPFGDQPLAQLQRHLANVAANMTTNSAYTLATNWLGALSVDVNALEKKYAPAVQQHFYRGSGGSIVSLPIFDVFWGENDKPAVIVTLYGPTAELLQLRQNDEMFSRRLPDLINDVEMLLAIPDAEFQQYTLLQRSNLVATALNGKVPSRNGR